MIFSDIRTKFSSSSSYACVAFIIPVIAVFSSKAMVPLLVLLCLTLLINEGLNSFRLSQLPKVLATGFVLFLFWCLTSVFWAVDSWIALRGIGPLALLVSLGLISVGSASNLEGKKAAALTGGLMVGMFCSLVIVVFEATTLSWITRQIKGIGWPDVLTETHGGRNLEAFLKDGLTILSLLIWPVCFHLWNSKYWFVIGLFGLAMVAASVHFSANAVLIALFAGSIFTLLGALNQKITGRILALITVAVIIFTPFILKPLTSPKAITSALQITDPVQLPASAIARLHIWQFVIDRIDKKPFLGWGMNASRVVPGASEKRNIPRLRDDGTIHYYREFNLPLHPHNQALQIWLELGLVGSLVVSIFGGLVIWKFSNNQYGRPFSSMMYGLIVSILTYDLLSFGAWQNWWIAIQFLSVAIFLASRRATGNQAQTSNNTNNQGLIQ